MNIDLIREETPGCACPNPRVHFNNAGAALPPKQVVEAIKQHLDVEACLGGYEAAKLAQEAFAKVYFDIAALINASDPAEIACVENATRAYDYILYSIVYNDTTHPAQSIIVTSSSEYGSNQIALMQVARQRKARIQLIPCTIYGSICVISLSHFLQQYHEEVIVVSLTWIPTNGGIINPAAEVGEVCRRYKVPFLLDACQAVGQINVDVQALKCDALCATGRKYLRGPRGIGFLYVRKNSVFAQTEPIFLDVHAACLQTDGTFEIEVGPGRRFENWEKPVALWLGLGTAVSYILKFGMANIENRIRSLGRNLRSKLGALDGVHLLDLGEDDSKCGIVSFNVDGHTAKEVHAALEAAGINTSVSRFTSTMHDMLSRGIDELVRASVHYYNIDSEIEFFVQHVSRIAKCHYKNVLEQAKRVA